MLSPHRTLSLALLALLAATPPAGAGEVARFDFAVDGRSEGWEASGASRLVAGGLLTGVAETADPQLSHGPLERAPGAAWDTLAVKVREVEPSGAVVPHDDLGVLLLLGVDTGPGVKNLGPPTTVSAPDAAGFRTLAWDLSGFAPASTGNVRLDPIGGPDAVRAGAANNRFEIDSIVFHDTSGG